MDANLCAGQLRATVTYSCCYTGFPIQTTVMTQESHHAGHAGPGGHARVPKPSLRS
jgi:hypothetical protein